MKETKRSSRFIKLNSLYIEAGELAQEIGKYYMEDLLKAVENSKEHGIDKLYFLVSFRKNPLDPKKMHIKIGITDMPIKKLRENFDLWSYDYKQDKLGLLWSLPHRYEMRTYLKTPEKFSQDLIGWIKAFEKQEGIDLNQIEKCSYKIG